MSKYYLNEDKTYRPAELIEWATQLEHMDNHVACEVVLCKTVSTIWLGLDHGFREERPLVFETMVFSEYDSGTDIYMDRYSTWDEAVEGHQKAVEWVRKHYG